MSAYTELKRPLCAAGCGRSINRANGVCIFCTANRPPPLPLTKLLPLEYLVSCVAELNRRRDELNAVLAKAEGN